MKIGEVKKAQGVAFFFIIAKASKAERVASLLHLGMWKFARGGFFFQCHDVSELLFFLIS